MISCALREASTFVDAMTVDAGLPAMISRDRLGPERAQMPPENDGGISSARIWLIRLPVSVSSPFVALTSMASLGIASRTCLTLSLNVRDGTTKSTRSASDNASHCEAVTDNEPGKATPGRKRAFSRAAFRLSASCSVRDQMLTFKPCLAMMTPSVVPQLVVPTMPTFGIFRP